MLLLTYLHVHAFTPLYSKGNLIADPTFDSPNIAAGGYGGTAVISSSEGYEGACASINPNGEGVLQRLLISANNNELKPMTKYRVRFMAKNTGTNGGFAMAVVEGVNPGGANFYYIKQSSSYITCDYTFTTQEAVGTAKIYISSWSDLTMTDGITYIDNFEMYEVPGITASVNGIAFDANTISQRFVLSISGAATATATIVAPTGISLNSTSVVTTQGSVITASWDGTTPVDGQIQVTAGSLTYNLPVKAFTTPVNSTYVPLNSHKNLIADPEFNSPTLQQGGFEGWGYQEICSDPAIVYSGSRCGAILPDNNYRLNWSPGSIERTFTVDNENELKPSTTYAIKAKVWAVEGTLQMAVKHFDGTSELLFEIPKSTTWTDFYQEFTTGVTFGDDPRISLHTWNQYIAAGYIDNWEVREVMANGVELNFESNLSVHVSKNQIEITGTANGDIVKVYSISGLQINAVKATSNKTIIDLKNGVYLLKVNSKVIKVII